LEFVASLIYVDLCDPNYLFQYILMNADSLKDLC
jgi:hypothetical protein